MTTRLLPDRTISILTTADATQTQIATYAITAGSINFYEVRVVGRSAADALTEYTAGGVNDIGGVTTLVPSITQLLSLNRTAGAALWLLTVDVSGTNLRARVTGAAATTITWLCEIAVWVYIA